MPNSPFPYSTLGTIPGEHVATGNVFYVDSGAANASDGNIGNPKKPMATWDAAIARCTANNGDIIVLMPGHAETTTAAITMDVAGVKVLGLGWGRSLPAITGNFAGDVVTVTAANCWIENVRFVASSAVTTSQINVAAADLTVRKCTIEQGANPLIGMTVASGGNRLTIQDCKWLGTANGPDVAIDFESSGSDDILIERCVFDFMANGCDLGIIRAANDRVQGFVMNDCQFLGVDTVAIDFNSTAANTVDGVITRCSFVAGGSITSIEDIVDVGGNVLVECYAASGEALNVAGARVPITTAA